MLLDLMLPDRNGLDVLDDIRRHGRRAAGRHGHGLRHDRERDRRDEAGRVPLLHEAVQERRSAGGAAQRHRAAAAGAREPRAARSPAIGLAPLRRDHRRQPEDEAVYDLISARGAEPDDGADPGRERHGQGAGRPRVSPAIGARRQAVHHRQLRQSAARSPRVESLRPRQRRVHRRGVSEEGSLRAGRQGHDLLRRDRQHPDRHAGQAAARHPGARVHAPRRRRERSRSTSGSSPRPTSTCAR